MNGMFVCVLLILIIQDFHWVPQLASQLRMLGGIDQENIIILQRWNRNHDDYCEEYEKEEEYCMIGW